MIGFMMPSNRSGAILPEVIQVRKSRLSGESVVVGTGAVATVPYERVTLQPAKERPILAALLEGLAEREAEVITTHVSARSSGDWRAMQDERSRPGPEIIALQRALQL
jgi:hypothetical protein